ncbi:MAG: NADH-quinone oxidoreductase subunit [Frankiaceae bacterium]|nr:NADH-quinone oxidoreductase subunit [Frankiaceae bacterium]
MATTESATVTVTFDGREVHVPPGTPLVVAAAHAGVEIPVFCYEPRLGPPVGACRMCLVEVEMGGRPMPKLQAACTLTAADGMVIHSHSDRAREGQDAVLEFLLLNHPLDCPVCDKGGECPLQDLAFRYGPGKSRMTLPKRTYEKPLPISPSIVLDRERCILCYRCTRFSSDVAEDGELIARERGAASVIATFEERAYVGAFSGNVTELCPVGALLPTPYRFKARPWEIVNVPSVCGGCAVGCNTWASVREGRTERVLSRNHPEVDEGWLCDRGRFARHEPIDDRLSEPLMRSETGLGAVSWDEATRTIAQRLRHVDALEGPGSVAIVTGGNLTNEEAYAWGRIARGVRATTASGPVARAGAWELLDPYAARIDDLDRADVIAVVGEGDVADRGGVLDLRIRKARRRGAHLMIIGPGGTLLERDAGSVRQTGDASTAEALADLVRDPGPLATATCPVLIVTDGVDVTAIAAAAHALGLHERGGVLPLPTGPNERGARLCGLAGGGDEVLAAIEAGTVHALVLVGVDPTAEWPEADRWQMALSQLRHVVTVSPFVNTSVSWSHIVLPQAVDYEREGTTTNLEGRIQRLRPATKPPSGVPDLAAYVAIAGQLGIEVSPAPSRAYAQLAGELGIPLSWSELNGRAPVPARARPAAVAPVAPEPPVGVPPAIGRFALIAQRTLFTGAAVERTPALAHQRAPWVMLNHEDAARLGVSEHDVVAVRHAGGEHTGPVRTSRRLRPRAVRINWAGPPVSGDAEVVPA